MSALVYPVVRRKPGDPLLYVFARQDTGWRTHAMAFKELEQIEQSGWVVGEWTSDEHGEYAPLTRVM